MNPSAISLVSGGMLLLLPVVLPAPEGLSGSAWLAAGLAAAMALWWVTEALPLAATALLPLAYAPLVGIAQIEEVAGAYGDPLIVLFLGGFLIARAIERSGLHRRMSAALLALAGTSPRRCLGAIMLGTAFLSLWISNTASAMVMAPIAAALAASQDAHARFPTALMLGVAFSATIGGMGSLIGTPPNAIFAAYVSSTYGITVGFAQWAAVGVPVALVLLALTWVVLGFVSPGTGTAPLCPPERQEASAMGVAERRVAWVAGLTALAWFSRPLLEWFWPVEGLSDAGIAMVAALVLFVLPDGKGGRVLDWDTAATLRWDVLILFGGGLALAGLLQQTGLADRIGAAVVGYAYLPELFLLLIIAAVIVYVGELASNTAMAAIFLPITGAVATGIGADPVAFMLPVALAASIGFMLPVATPPNAIVFSDPSVTRADMLRAGAPLDIIALFVTVVIGSILGPVVFG